MTGSTHFSTTQIARPQWAGLADWRSLALFGWFAAVDVWFNLPSMPDIIGADAGLYTRAAADWLAGRDPWQLDGSWLVFQFSGLPPTVLSFVPFNVIPEMAARLLWVAISLAAAVWILRVLERPLWWLAFPPLFSGIVIGNPHTLIVALALSPLAFLAPLTKVYGSAFLVAERRWRALVIAVLIVASTVLIAPGLWSSWIGHAGLISERLLFQAHGGWSAYLLLPIAAVLGLVALWRLGWRKAGWWAVPLAWPATEFIYGSALLPVASTVALVIVAIPLPFMVVPALLAELVLSRSQDRLEDA